MTSPGGDDSSQSPVSGLVPTTAHERAKALIALQTFLGYFPLTPTLAEILCVPFQVLETKLIEFSRTVSVGLEGEALQRVWGTLLTIAAFENLLSGEREMWELVVLKANKWVLDTGSVLGVEGLKKLKGLAMQVLGESKGLN
jgi:hypothetical protein